MPKTIRIAMWSGPRNISTAMMRAWENRADTTVMDEPFYGAYLKTTGRQHPMRDTVIAHHPTDWDEIAAQCSTARGAPIVYQKHMCQHMIDGAPLAWLRDVRHAFLIRPPHAVAASFHDRWSDMNGAEDLGYRRQAELFDHICQITGMAPPVIEARDVLERPEAMLPAICGSLGVEFDPAMLSWPAGPRQTDGVWGRHWYSKVEASTGFSNYREPGPVPAELERVVEDCLPYYDTMRGWRLGPVEAGE